MANAVDKKKVVPPTPSTTTAPTTNSVVSTRSVNTPAPKRAAEKPKLASKPRPSKNRVVKKKTSDSNSKTKKKSRKSKKGGIFGCCTKKRKVKRSSAKRAPPTIRTVRTPPPPGKKVVNKTRSNSKKSSKEAQKSFKPAAPVKPNASAQSAGLIAGPPSLMPPTLPTSTTTSGMTTEMVTAPSPLAAPVETKSPPIALVPAQKTPSKEKTIKPSAETAEPPKDEIEKEDDEPSFAHKSNAYPAHKFFLTQYVKNECRVRRWVYEDSMPLAMDSNMKHMLKVAAAKVKLCQNEKQRRGEMIKDLNQLSNILGA